MTLSHLGNRCIPNWQSNQIRKAEVSTSLTLLSLVSFLLLAFKERFNPLKFATNTWRCRAKFDTPSGRGSLAEANMIVDTALSGNDA